jgi:hypothetical protein
VSAKPEKLPETAVLSFLAAEHERVAGAAAHRGDLVHSYVEDRILGRPEPEGGYDPSIKGHRIQFENFLDTVRPEFDAVEETVFSRKGRHIGTMDFRARIDGRLLTGDVKTGNGIHPEYGLQLSAYRHSTHRIVNGQEIENPETEGAVVLRLRPRSWQLVPVDTSEPVYRAFRFAAGLWHFQNYLAGAVVGEAIATDKTGGLV